MTDSDDLSPLDAELIDVLWRANLDPPPRIVSSWLVNRGEGYLFPGSVWPDGRARLVTHPFTALDVPGVLRQLATKDAPDPGPEPSDTTGGAS